MPWEECKKRKNEQDSIREEKACRVTPDVVFCLKNSKKS
jgi:hypothetical protein